MIALLSPLFISLTLFLSLFLSTPEGRARVRGGGIGGQGSTKIECIIIVILRSHNCKPKLLLVDGKKNKMGRTVRLTTFSSNIDTGIELATMQPEKTHTFFRGLLFRLNFLQRKKKTSIFTRITPT